MLVEVVTAAVRAPTADRHGLLAFGEQSDRSVARIIGCSRSITSISDSANPFVCVAAAVHAAAGVGAEATMEKSE